MKIKISILLVVMFFVGCGTKVQVKSSFPEHYRTKIAKVVVNADAVLIARQDVDELARQIRALLSNKALYAQVDGDNYLIMSLKIVRYNNRNNMARVMTGIFSGEDLIESRVAVTESGGRVVGEADVISYNSLAVQADYGIVGKHARDVVKVIE